MKKRILFLAISFLSFEFSSAGLKTGDGNK
jgi:hypothetical protein